MIRTRASRFGVVALLLSLATAQLAACGDDKDGPSGDAGGGSETSANADAASGGDTSSADGASSDGATDAAADGDPTTDGAIDTGVDAGLAANGCEEIDPTVFATCADAGSPTRTPLGACSTTDFGDSYDTSAIEDVGACGLMVVRAGTTLIRVNPDTGERTCFGTLPCVPVNLVRSRDRSLLALCASSVLAVDLGAASYRELSPGSTPNARSGFAEFENGDLVYSSASTNGEPTLYEIDRCTGQRKVLSSTAPDAGVGSGSSISSYDRIPLAIAPNASDLLAYGQAQAMRVEYASGNRTVFSTTCATNAFLDFPNDVVRVDTDSVVAVHRYMQWNHAKGSAGTLCADLRSMTTTGTVANVSGWTGGRTAPVLVGEGTQFIYPMDVTRRADGRVFVIDANLSAVVQVDVANGNRVVVGRAAFSRGTGWAFADPTLVELGTDGMLYVADFLAHQNSSHKAIFRVDPATGNRTLLTSNLAPTGAPFFAVAGDVVTGFAGPTSGKLSLRIVNDTTTSHMDVTVATGARAAGSSGTFRDPKRVNVGGTFYAIVGATVIRETDAGNDVIASSATGTGTPLIAPSAIAALPDSTLVVADTRTNLLVKIDPTTGARTVLSGIGNL